jgi:hypothetical protein
MEVDGARRRLGLEVGGSAAEAEGLCALLGHDGVFFGVCRGAVSMQTLQTGGVAGCWQETVSRFTSAGGELTVCFGWND